LRFRHAGRRVGASEVVGAILAIAITLVAGAAAWGYARNQAVVSESALQTNYGITNNFLNEKFEVTTMYFGSTTQATFWIYNLGTLTFSPFSVRLYDSAGLINLEYNYTGSGASRTDRVYDLSSSLATKCKTAASSYESPILTTSTVKSTNQQTFALTIPGTLSNCPSFGQTFASGTTYTVIVTGLYGNVYTYAQVK
jgi:hypothetical protein